MPARVRLDCGATGKKTRQFHGSDRRPGVGVSMTSAGTACQGSVMEIAFRTRLKGGVRPSQLVAAFNRIEGVQAVELQAEGSGEPV